VLIFSKLAFQSHKYRISESANHPPVSVIICAKNELTNLKKFLPSILRQDYPEFEVLVVNDRSTDDSQIWLEDLSRQNPTLRIIKNFGETLPGKRSALLKGIESAKNDWLLLTDADCQPASEDWIKLMTSAVNGKTEVVLGFSPVFMQRSMLNKFIRYENFVTGLYYLSFSLAGMPYMGVGRNLLYRKSVTTKTGALEHHSSMISGDDDLTVNRIATAQNTSLMIHPNSQVFTVPAATTAEFIQQKRRHYSAGFHYRRKHRMVLGTLYAAQIIFNLTLIPMLVTGFMPIPAIVIFIFKNILQTLIHGKAMQKLNVHNLWIFTPVFDLCLSLFFITLGGLSLFKTQTWK